MRQLNENQIFQYNGSPITFQKGDSVMVNATEMAKPFGKRCNDFLSTKQTKELISSLSAKTGISATGLVTVNPVSYTHLDVYKRQVQCIRMKMGKRFSNL